MQITLGWWLIPAALTALFLWLTFRRDRNARPSGGGIMPFPDLTIFFRLLWLIPVGFVWAIYFAAIALTRT